MALPVFKTGEAEYLGLAGSIPVRLRHGVCDGHAAPMTDPRRSLPRTDAVLSDPRLAEATARLGRHAVKQAVVDALDRARHGELRGDEVADAAAATLPARATNLRPVLNATGIVLHTNLGRAPLSRAAIDALTAAASYVDVEYDLTSGTRATRGRGALAALREAVPDAEDVLIVNNGAAALVLATTALACGREVLVSRGELVEIGDGFRLPDLIESTGARIREVGTTNRTTISDYCGAIGEITACVLKIHPSNFRIEGFTASVGTRELAALPVPLVVDVGSGLLAPDRLLPEEPDVSTALRAGAGLVTCSGDKLLGGPQSGLIFGKSEIVQLLRRHPLARALRTDKLTLAALEATIRAQGTPTSNYLRATGLKQRCERLAQAISAEVVPSVGAVGGGGGTGVSLPGWAVALPPEYAERLRRGNPPVIGRVEQGRCLLDLRAIPPAEDDSVRDAVLAARG